jgi:hypothetical protein
MEATVAVNPHPRSLWSGVAQNQHKKIEALPTHFDFHQLRTDSFERARL